MCVFLGRAINFFWPQSRGAIAPHGSAACVSPSTKILAMPLHKLVWAYSDFRLAWAMQA